MDQVSLFCQQLLNGLSLGSIYALIALGYTMVYGVLRFSNFAHGDVYMLGAFSGFMIAPTVCRLIPLDKFQEFTPENALLIIGGASLVMIISMLVCAVTCVLIEQIAYRPVPVRSRLAGLFSVI